MKLKIKYSRFKIKLNLIIVGLMILGNACSLNNITEKPAYKQYFEAEQVRGCFTLYNNANGEFYIYNLKRYADSTYLPSSTFNIVNGLIAIETGVVNNEKMNFIWDRNIRRFPNGGDTAKDWNKDQNFKEAFQNYAQPVFQNIALKIGPERMQYWLDSLKYGNKNIGKDITQFWLNNELLLSPDEQMGLIKKLYFNKLPFQKRTQTIIKNLFSEEKKGNLQINYTTGYGFTPTNNALGWVIGWIIESNHPYFFVLNIEGDHTTNINQVRENILNNILMDFFNQKKQQ